MSVDSVDTSPALGVELDEVCGGDGGDAAIGVGVGWGQWGEWVFQIFVQCIGLPAHDGEPEKWRQRT